MPAKKPRTECCCQPVTSIRLATLAPVFDRNIAIARDCLVTGTAVVGQAGLFFRLAVFERGVFLRVAVRLFVDFGIEILPVIAAFTAASPKPRLGVEAGGAGSLASFLAFN